MSLVPGGSSSTGTTMLLLGWAGIARLRRVEAAADYVHGYSARERTRLSDQATTLTELLHADTRYGPGRRVLEAGCGTGAQTVILAEQSPQANFTSIDISDRSLAAAKQQVQSRGYANVRFLRADVFSLPFRPASFDHIFVCFVLEHLRDPEGALHSLLTVLAPGGSITVIEGDHGSAFFHPDSAAARMAISCLIDLQRQAGGDPLIGRRLYPLLAKSGYREVEVSPRTAYADGSVPQLADNFTRKTFAAMVDGVAAQAVSQGLIDEATWAAGLRDLRRAAEIDGTFCYTFFKAVALR
jgi:ubiquinone/menaquinone biosynthesis C-methylase UbiE